MYFGYFVFISPWKRVWSFIWTILKPPSTKDALYQFWLKLAQQFWRRWKCEKFMDRRTDRQMDKRWLEKLTWAFNSGELKNKDKCISQFQCIQRWYFCCGWRSAQQGSLLHYENHFKNKNIYIFIYPLSTLNYKADIIYI